MTDPIQQNQNDSASGAMNELKTPDRRARKTRRQLKEALFALILEKGYDAVTIEDITERADLGRTTFYLHYHDKEDLLLESIDVVAQDLIDRLPESAWRVADSPSQQPGGAPEAGMPNAFVYDAILVTFQHAAENAQLYRIIFRGEGATRAHQRLFQIIRSKAIELVSARAADGTLRPQLPPEVFASYFAGALLATITWWLEAQIPFPPEQMAGMFRMLFFQGGRKVLGIE